LGAGGLAVVGLVVGLLVMNSASRARPGSADKDAKAADSSAPGLMERIMSAAGAATSDSNDPAKYPSLGDLPPPLLPPPPLRDLSAHERQQRVLTSFISRMNDILASVHDVASMQSAAGQLKNLGEQADNELRQAAPPFPLNAAEQAELMRRMAGEIRREVERSRKESIRISGVPGLGIAGTQLLVVVTRLSIPLEQSLMMAEKFKPRTGPDPYAEVYVKIENEDAEIVIRQKLRALIDGPPGMQWTHGSDFKTASYRVWPVHDVQYFADKITFGKTVVKGRMIFVVADPVSPADATAARDAAKKEEEAFKAKLAAGTPKDDPKDPKPPAGADKVTVALFGLRSSNVEKRKDAVGQLRRFTPEDARSEEVTKQLLPLLDEQDGFFVIDVMKAMANWPSKETVPSLIKKLDDERHGVRWAAAEILGKLGDARAAEPLARHLKNDGIAAEPALKKLGSAAEPALIELLSDPDPELRRQACDLLGAIGGKAALETMMSLPADRDELVKMAARNAMKSLRARVGPVSVPKKSATKSKRRQSDP
jgi:hypothetical protein